MAAALASGFPVAFALPGSAILTIGLAAICGAIFTGESDAFFAHDGPLQWLSAGVTNFRGVYWEPERDTLIAIPLFVFLGIVAFSVDDALYFAYYRQRRNSARLENNDGDRPISEVVLEGVVLERRTTYRRRRSTGASRR